MPTPAPAPASAPAKKVIDATVPGSQNSPVKNISDEEKKRIIDKWDQEAEDRKAAVARETATPAKPTKVLVFELHQYGRYWQAFAVDGKRKERVPLLGAPSLLASALDALEDAMLNRASKL